MIDEYFDRDGLPLAIQEFGHLCRDWSYRVVGKDSTPNGDISTVWLGMEHGFVNGRPVIFETMVFGGVFDQAQERYCTDAEAREGHARWLAKVLMRANPDDPHRIVSAVYPTADDAWAYYVHRDSLDDAAYYVARIVQEDT